MSHTGDMKTFFFSPKFVLLLVGITSIVAVVFAQQKGNSDPSKHGIRLIMGHKGNEALHCTEDSLNRALSKCDTKSYKIKYRDAKGANWEKGDLADPSVTMVTSARPETGGPTPAGSLAGVHSTQAISFASTEDLKAFVSALDPAP